MTSPPSNTLTPEERDLAGRLARLGPQGEPSPALDARILGAAHAATPARAGRAPRGRWPVVLGVAASLSLALGLAWQLRPVDDLPTWEAESSAPTASPGAAANARSMPGTAPAAAAMPEASEQAGGAPAEVVPSATQLPVDSAGPDRGQAAAARPGSSRPPALMQSPAASAPIAAPAPPPAPPEEPPASLQQPPAAFPAAAAKVRTTTGDIAPDPASPAPLAAPAPQQRQAAAAPDTRVGNPSAETAAMDDADANHDAQRHAWQDAQLRQQQLARIRGLREAGRPGAAREALRDFQQQWPDYPLPDDLQSLAR